MRVQWEPGENVEHAVAASGEVYRCRGSQYRSPKVQRQAVEKHAGMYWLQVCAEMEGSNECWN